MEMPMASLRRREVGYFTRERSFIVDCRMNPSVERDKGGSRFVPFVGKSALVLFEKQVNFPLFSKKREPLDSSARIQITTVHAHSVWFFETPVTHTRDRLH